MNTLDCSVIIPLYNAEETIIRCLESLALRDCWKYNIEIILINDGSSDNSNKIISEYIKEVENCKLINIEKHGVSTARNIGIKESRGRYIFFMDSDDTVNRKELDTIIEIADSSDCDIIISDYYLLSSKSSNRTSVCCNIIHNQILDRKYIETDVLKKIMTSNSRGLINIWNKLYRKKLIEDNDIAFDTEQIYGEDLIFNLKCYDKARTVIATEHFLYNYYSPETSMRSYKKRDYSYSLLSVFNELRHYNEKYALISVNDEAYIAFLTNFVRDVINFIKNTFIDDNAKVDLMKSEEVKRTVAQIKDIKNVKLMFSKREKLGLRLVNKGYYRLAIKIIK